MKACIAVPSIREDCLQKLLSAWNIQFQGHSIVVVEDNPTKTFNLPSYVTHAAWDDIEKDLGKDAWIISRRSGSIRSYAMLLAARQNPDMVVMLDDDCLPASESFLFDHWDVLEMVCTYEPVFDTMHASDCGVTARGYPKELKSITTVVNHGMWNNIPDIDGRTQLKHPTLRTVFPKQSEQVPRGVLFPLSAMNVAFRPEALPAMYQFPMGQGQPYERYDDIWCGWVMKKAMDAAGLGVRSGSPLIYHSRASNAHRNAEIEIPGMSENEVAFRHVLSMIVPSGSLESCLENVHSQLSPLGS